MGILTPDLGGERGVLVRQSPYTAIDSHTVITATAVPEILTPKPDRATGVLIQTVGDNILFTLDGTDPSVTAGFVLYTGLMPIFFPITDEVILTIVRETTNTSVRYQWVREES